MPTICCIEVTTETSPLVQELLFSYGYSWRGLDKSVSYINRRLLALWDDKAIYYGDHIEDDDVLLTFSELLEFLKTGKLPNKKTEIDDLVILFHKDEIEIKKIGNEPLIIENETFEKVIKQYELRSN
jgi:hypothetical protein